MFLNLNQVKSPLDPRCRRSPSLRWVLGDPSYENRRKMSQENQGLVNTYALMIGHPGLNSKVVQNYPPSPLQHSLSRTMLLGFCRSSQQVLKKPTYSKIGYIDRIIHRPNPWKRFSCFFFFFWRKWTNINVSFICKLLESHIKGMVKNHSNTQPILNYSYFCLFSVFTGHYECSRKCAFKNPLLIG